MKNFMAKVLLNFIILTTGAMYPGQTVSAEEVANVQAAGGTLADDNDPNIAQAAETCRSLLGSGRGDAASLAQVMGNAVNKTQNAATGGVYELHLTAAIVAGKGPVASYDWWNFTVGDGARISANLRVVQWFDTSPTGGVVNLQLGVGGDFPPVITPPFPGGLIVSATYESGGNPPPTQLGTLALFADPQRYQIDKSLVGAQELTIRLVTDGATVLSDYVVGDMTFVIEVRYPTVIAIAP